jgi:transaldolase
MNSISTLHLLGQSIWYDNIQRRMLDNGDLARMIARGEIKGVTSNPTIFNNAIAKSSDYDAALARLAQQGKSSEEIFFSLAIDDIRAAADLLFPLYQQTHGGDGYVSLEVSPFLANNSDGTVAQANQLWQWVNRPNLMIKIPATRAGIPAIAKSIESGINVNVTLIFSLARYAEVMDAYLCGLENRAQNGLPVETIASVASFFVSRVDTKIDARLQALAGGANPDAVKAGGLLGKAAIANAKMAYAQFLEVFAGDRFSRLRQKGARVQRPLWASTGTKNAAYRDVVYIEELIGPDTVNTVPPQTLDAFRDHGRARLSIQENLQAAQEALNELEALQISMDQVTTELEEEGVKAFSDAFTSLLKTIESRRLGA